MELDLNNVSPREVIAEFDAKQLCGVSSYYPNLSLLTSGNTYHLESLEVGSWCSWVCLEEFPGKKFNSCMFAEIEGYTSPTKTEETKKLSFGEKVTNWFAARW